MAPPVTLTLRLHPKLHARLRDHAEREDQSLNSDICRLVERGLDDADVLRHALLDDGASIFDPPGPDAMSPETVALARLHRIASGAALYAVRDELRRRGHELPDA